MFAALHPGNRLVLPVEHSPQFISGFNPFPAGEGEGRGLIEQTQCVYLYEAVKVFDLPSKFVPQKKITNLAFTGRYFLNYLIYLL